MSFKYLNEANFSYLCQGLTLDISDMGLIDQSLEQMNKQLGLLDRIVAHNVQHGADSSLDVDGPQIIIKFDKYLKDGKPLSTVVIGKQLNEPGLPPMVHINLHSPSLNIPQRVEIPLRYLINGMPPLVGTYMVYLHALIIDDKETFVYYGITKRGWMKRFQEHMKLAMKGTHRRFPQLLGDSIKARRDQLLGLNGNPQHILTGTYHVVCAAGRTKADAFAIERYLIDKRSINLPVGLNMI
ncbi:MAG: hypothetical protein DI535_03845 [Citrobacter freundii]|nr:MAG: hypothetical protein DI535_03845 [Citrobacter freundii]